VLDRFDLDALASNVAGVHGLVDDCLATGRSFATVVPFDGASPRPRWVLWSGEPTGAGADARVSGWVVDVTAPILRVTGEQTTSHLHAAMAGRQVIDLIKGALMASYGVDPDAAFDLLVWCSQRTNVRVHDLSARVATELVTGGGVGSRSSRDALERALVDGLAATVREDGEDAGPPRTPMTLRHSSAGGATILAVAGTIDLGTAPTLAAEIARRLDRLRPGDVLLVDLSEVDHVGPAGVWVVESLARRGRAAGVELRLVAPPRRDSVLAPGADSLVVEGEAGAGAAEPARP
jgi:anti-anti-sigma factor